MNGSLPASAELGLRLAIVGALAMLNGLAAELRPLALNTRMDAVPGVASSAAGAVAEQAVVLVHDEASTVVCALNVHVTEERLVNPVPVMPTVWVLLPAPAADGRSVPITGVVS